VFRVGAATRLANLFKVTEVDGAALGSPLSAYLLRPNNPRAEYPVAAGRLTVDRMWEAWLSQDLGLDVDGGLALDTFLGWAAMNERGPQTLEELERDGAAGVRDKLLDHLGARLGAAGPIVWKLWEAGRARAALELGILFEPLVGTEHVGIRMWMRLVAKNELGCSSDEEALQVAAILGKAAGVALRALERTSGAAEAAAIVQTADARSVEAEVRDALRASTRLPSSWQMRLDALGEVLAQGAADPSQEALRAARKARRALEGHALFKEESHTETAKRAEMAVRLLSWLTARPDENLPVPPQPHAVTEVLGQWYAEEGGYLDLARERARGSSEGAFGRGVQKVVEAVDRARQELDQRFARGLVEWVRAGRPASVVLPIDQALKRIGVRFLGQSEHRRLLVLLVDGMGWAQAVELLESLGCRAPAWGPASWHVSKEGRITDGQRYPVVLANLPTVTETSRAAFFAGKPLGPGDVRDTAKDPERFAAHREVKALFEGAAVPRLLLRSSGHTSFGAATSEALHLVRDTSQRVVGIVINAVDDSLKSSKQVVHTWTVSSISSLVDLLECARESGRAVLFASDHGHVPGGRLENVGARTGGGARWRPWAGPSDELKEYEVAVSGSAVNAPKGAEGVVLLTNDATSYGGTTHAGEHGGATLAEVVAPCLLLTFDDPIQRTAEGDKALVPMGAYVPEWWHYEVGARQPEADETPKQPSVRRKKSKPPPEEQLTLGLAHEPPHEMPPRALPQTSGAVPSPNMDSAFAKCDMLEARAPKLATRKLVVQAVQYLLERGGYAPGDAFAPVMGYLPFRVRGLVSNLQEVLNVDGYAVLEFDSVSNQVRLDREKLEQQFEVKL
ncbi:MAG: BREX-2 system phosphatase PglZ, partial [Polyangiaceae bacterium]|nr:BREX-2 system phosphatase PglZ [Polyangiaceae bacterium]